MRRRKRQRVGEGPRRPAKGAGGRKRVHADLPPTQPPPPVTDLHYCGERALCTDGCGALLWPCVSALCCSKGAHILGPKFNPPIPPEWLDIVKLPRISANSSQLTPCSP